MSIKDTIIRTLALGWLRGKTKDLRGKYKETGMGKVLKALDGWKLVIGVVGLFGVNVWDAYHNGHSGQLVGSVLTTLGWLPPGDWTGEAMTKAVLGGIALFGFTHKLVKAQQQVKAGSSVAGALSAEGYVAQAVVDGKI